MGYSVTGRVSLDRHAEPLAFSAAWISSSFESAGVAIDSIAEIRCGRLLHGLYVRNVLARDLGGQVVTRRGSLWHRRARSIAARSQEMEALDQKAAMASTVPPGERGDRAIQWRSRVDELTRNS